MSLESLAPVAAVTRVLPMSNGRSITSLPASGPFAKTLAEAQVQSAMQGSEDTNLRVPKPEYTQGRLTVGIDSRGQPASLTYHAEDGTRLSTSAFHAAQILENAHAYGIDLKDLRGLGQQLDADGIGYRPYELYPGTGSDHGIDFEDLITGGMGTAYDWRKDPLLSLKGASARLSLGHAQQVANDLCVVNHAAVTTERGIDPERFAPLAAGSEAPRRHVAFNGKVASWHANEERASAAAWTMGGRTLDLAPTLRPKATTDLLWDQLLRADG